MSDTVQAKLFVLFIKKCVIINLDLLKSSVSVMT